MGNGPTNLKLRISQSYVRATNLREVVIGLFGISTDRCWARKTAPEEAAVNRAWVGRVRIVCKQMRLVPGGQYAGKHRWTIRPANRRTRSLSQIDALEKISADPRITVRTETPPNHDGRCVLYWMRRSQRAFDNPALEAAIAAANVLRKPVVVFFCLMRNLSGTNARNASFMIDGIADTAQRLERRRIGFIIRIADAAQAAGEFASVGAELRPALVVIDENPLRRGNSRVVLEAARAPIWSVDADVIVPSAILAKEQYAARTIRPRIHAQLGRFLGPVGNRAVTVPWAARKPPRSLEPSADGLMVALNPNRAVSAVGELRGGTREALGALEDFVRERLGGYAERRNRPEAAGTSRLSPYLHFGQIGPHTVAQAARAASGVSAASRDAFLEELIVRRELAINFVRFNPRYARLDSCEPWALRTLEAHQNDPRPYRYSERALEDAETHDPLWNAAQRQMVLSGWMHGYMRMYWAKKILEWSRSAAEAYEIAARLNDRYELDGRDPNGYAGIAWAIGGKHDRPWAPQRPIFGMVRYMSYDSTRRKFDSRAYIQRWAGAEPDLFKG